MSSDTVVIVSAKRTPIGNFQGCLQTLSATDLGAKAIQSAVATSTISSDEIDAVIMGCVLPAGLRQAPARQAALGAGLPTHVGCTTVNKVCGSGMQSIIFAHDSLRSGNARIAVAGGMESMSNAPYLLPKARSGYRLGHQSVLDHLFIDGLEDAYEHKLMGYYAEKCVKHFNFTREDQDNFALKSVQKAHDATAKGFFNDEIISVHVKDQMISLDEGPQTARPEKIPQLKPAFAADGTITAANASSISDGAAALVLMTESQAKELNLSPLARLVAHSSYSQDPTFFTTAPIGAIKLLLEKTGWNIEDVDLFEINEAFAAVALAAITALELDPNKVNIHGGACVLGHPLGASGARIVVTLIHALRTHGLKKGIAALCIGGGEATAVAVEII
ncbi:MAG: acetyl-CoA C-acyltransferase [Gammaproteobacteria bacterium]|nr:acetyl-CoA C-acyltransferase [Gammaproteobacteria bacterium]